MMVCRKSCCRWVTLCKLHGKKILFDSPIHARFSTKADLLERSTENVDLFVKKYQCLGAVRKKKAFYILDKEIAVSVVEALKKNIVKNNLIIEVNPGPGFLTEALLNEVTDKLITVESHSEFLPYLKDFQERRKDVNFDYIHHNLFSTNKSMVKSEDKSQKESEANIVELIPSVPWQEDVSASVLGILPPEREMLFLQYLAHNFCHNVGIFKAGRLQWFLLVSPRCYRKMISNENRRINILLDLFFDINICSNIPYSSIYPRYPKLKIKRMADSVDANMIYLVQLTPKINALSLIQPDEIFKFSFFLRQLLVKKTERLIPRMEQLVPGCGIHLIKDGFTMMQTVKTLPAQQCLKLYKILPSIPEYYTSGWRNFLVTEGLIIDDEDNVPDSDTHL